MSLTPNPEKSTAINDFLQKEYAGSLSVPEIIEYKTRLVNFFRLLIAIDKRIHAGAKDAQNLGNPDCAH